MYLKLFGYLIFAFKYKCIHIIVDAFMHIPKGPPIINIMITTVVAVEMVNTILGVYAVKKNISNVTMDSNLTMVSNVTMDSNVTMEYKRGQAKLACDLVNAGVLALVMPFILAGNFLVILAVIKFRKLRTSLNMFVASLAVSDMLVAFPTIPLYVTYYVKGEVLRNFKYLCLTRYAFVVASMSGSIISLTFVSFDRYVAVLHPMHYPSIMTKRRVQLMLFGIWSYGAIFSLIPYAGVNVWRQDIPCQFFHVLPKWYTFFTVPFVMAVCLILSTSMYLVVFRVAKKHQKRMRMVNVNSARKRQSKRRQVEKDTRTAKVMAFVLMLFVVFWLPFLASSLLKFLPFSQDIFEIIKNFALTIAMTNSMCNPLVYCYLRRNFRKAFRALLCCKKVLERGRNQSPNILRRNASWSLLCSSNTSSLETTFN